MSLNEFLRRLNTIYGNGNNEVWRRDLGRLFKLDRNMIQENRRPIIRRLRVLKPANKEESIDTVFSKLLAITMPMNNTVFEQWQSGEIGFEKAWENSVKFRNL